jgi:hypothetical protein
MHDRSCAGVYPPWAAGNNSLSGFTQASLLHVLSAVDRNVGAGYECGLFACQIRNESGHFPRDKRSISLKEGG